MKMNMENKIFSIESFKEEHSDEKFYVTGYANNKNVEDSYGDTPQGNSVYNLTRYRKNPVLLVNHKNETQSVIGSIVHLSETKRGLRFRALLMQNPKSLVAQHSIEAIKEGHLRALSIGGKWLYEDKKNPKILTRAEIFEISFVTIPSDQFALTEQDLPKKFEKEKGETLKMEEKTEEKKLNEMIEKNFKSLRLFMERSKSDEQESRTESQEKFEEKIDKKIEEKLQSIEVNMGQFKTEKKLKRFNKKTKKFEERPVSPESLTQFNTMLKTIANGDKASAISISKEIESENQKSVLRSDVGSAGGYAIPKELQEEIQTLEYEKSVILPQISTENIIFQEKIFPTYSTSSVAELSSQTSTLIDGAGEFSQPTVEMKRIGSQISISNTLIRQKGIDLTRTLTSSFSSAFASFVDANFFNKLTADTSFIKKENSAVAMNKTNLMKIKNLLSKDSNLETTFLCGVESVIDSIGIMENTNGAFLFPQYVSGMSIKPYGRRVLINNKIQQMDFSNGVTSGGSQTLPEKMIFIVDFSKIAFGLSEIRLDESMHAGFSSDQTIFRAIRNFGQKALFENTTPVVAVQKLS